MTQTKRSTRRRTTASSHRQVSRRKSSQSLPILAAVLVVVSLVVFAFRSYRSSRLPAPVSINQVGVADGRVILSLVPATVNLAPDTETTLTLRIDAGPDRVGGASIELTYNQAKLGTPVLTQGDFLTDKFGTPQVGNGKISFTFLAPPPLDRGDAGVSGTGTLATIKIQPPISGTSTISFTSNSEIALIDDATNTTIQTNMLKSASDATITVSGASAAPSEEASAQPSASPSQAASSQPSASPSQAASANPSHSPSASPSQAASANPSQPASSQPSASPSDNSGIGGSNQQPSRTTSIRHTSTTCNSLSFAWDKISGASGYEIDLADNANFDNRTTSGPLGSDRDSYTFGNLRAGVQYYARVSQNNIWDWPRYTRLGPVSTLAACPGTTTVTLPSVKPSAGVIAKASVKPGTKLTSPYPSASFVPPSVTPYSPPPYEDSRFENVPVDPGTSPDREPQNFFEWIISVIVAMFEKIF